MRLDLTGELHDKLYVTWGQRKKIEEAMEKRRKELTLRFSVRQARHNIQSEGGFLGAMMAAATRFLPAILAGYLLVQLSTNLKEMECSWGRGIALTGYDITLDMDW